MVEKPLNLSRKSLGPGGLALPDRHHRPSEASKLSLDSSVTRHIPLQFGNPVVSATLGLSLSEAAGVTMPPASVNENNLPPTRKHEIRRARKLAAMEAESVAERVAKAAHQHFWLGVRVADATHHVASLLFRNVIHGY